MLQRARKAYRKARAALHPYDASDVLLNQPGRALARSILWWITAAAFATIPIGLVAYEVARIPAVNYVSANVAGLLLSGIFLQLLVAIVWAVWLVAFPRAHVQSGSAPTS